VTEAGVLDAPILDAPILAARTHAAESRERARVASDALLEMTRQRNGNAGRSVVDDVVRKFGIDPVTVQRSLWSLLANGRLATRENGDVIDPGHVAAQ
jgi:hypothetical protein